MKTFAILSCLLFLNFTSPEVNTKNCFNVESFNLLKAYIIENGSDIILHERIIAGVETVAKEVSFDNKYIELIQHPSGDVILVIDKSKKTPDYTCRLEGDHLKFSAYVSRFDIDKDKESRRSEWCILITKILSKK